MKPQLVIIEYGVCDDALNPTNYDPWAIFKSPRVALSDNDYWYNNNIPMAIRSSRHVAEIVGVVRKYMVTDFDIVAIPFSLAEKYLKENRDKIFVVSASVGGFFDDNFMAQFKNDFYMCISAGNEGIEGEGLGATKPYWTAIGAVTQDMQPAEYSSWGKGLVQFVGIAGEEIEYKYFGDKKSYIQGTSFACPQHATQIMNMMCAMYTKLNGLRKPTIKEVLKTRDTYCTDVFEVGKDLRTGFGYYGYKEGELIMSKVVKMTVGVKEYTVDGVVSVTPEESKIVFFKSDILHWAEKSFKNKKVLVGRFIII
jgi:hypothetical protein